MTKTKPKGPFNMAQPTMYWTQDELCRLYGADFFAHPQHTEFVNMNEQIYYSDSFQDNYLCRYTQCFSLLLDSKFSMNILPIDGTICGTRKVITKKKKS
jgi:hypothetical protein